MSVCHDSRTAAMSDLGSSAFVQSRRPGPPTPDLRAHRKTRRVCVLLPGGAALPLHGCHFMRKVEQSFGDRKSERDHDEGNASAVPHHS